MVFKMVTVQPTHSTGEVGPHNQYLNFTLYIFNVEIFITLNETQEEVLQKTNAKVTAE